MSCRQITLRSQFCCHLVRHVQKDAVVKGECHDEKSISLTMFLGVVFSLPAAADDTSLKFKGGIGVIPVSSVTCVPSATPCVTGPTVTVNQNVVRGQQPAGQIWVIDDLDAQVSATGVSWFTARGWFWAAAMALEGCPPD